MVVELLENTGHRIWSIRREGFDILLGPYEQSYPFVLPIPYSPLETHQNELLMHKVL